MDDDLRVKYPFISIRYRDYIRLQGAIIAALLVASALFFVFARDHGFWLLAHAWWVCLMAAGLEVLESLVAVRRAQRSHAESAND